MNLREWKNTKKGRVWVSVIRSAAIGLVCGWLIWPITYKIRRYEYDSKWAKYLALPPNLGSIFAATKHYGSRPGIQLAVDVFKPNESDDEALRSWVAKRNGLSSWVSDFPKMSSPLGAWTAVRGKYTYSFSRLDDRGWVHFFVYELPPDYGLERAINQQIKPKKPARPLAEPR